jgi:DNA mismatch endonuclease (patch repair protein)
MAPSYDCAMGTYPHPSSAAASAVMRGNRRSGTRPELALRALLHARGHRYRVDHRVDVAGTRVRPDLVFTRWRLAVFVDGCFWHRCPEHGTRPGHNPGYWAPKLDGNVARDRRVDAALTGAGWRVLRLWEHEPPEQAAERVEAALRDLRAG